MKILAVAYLLVVCGFSELAVAQSYDSEKFAEDYFDAWVSTQSPTASEADLERYLSFLAEDVGHQHLPYDPDDARISTGKQDMREGMGYYLGAHTEYKARLISHMSGHEVVVIKYETFSKGIHPQTKQENSLHYVTVEILEIENGLVSVIRKYSE